MTPEGVAEIRFRLRHNIALPPEAVEEILVALESAWAELELKEIVTP